MNTSSLPRSDARYERPFFIFLTLILIAMYVASIMGNPSLQAPLSLTIFTILMLVHLALHWSIFGIYNSPRWHLIYLILQGLLALPITYISGNIGMIFSLYLALIGESMGLLRDKKLSTVLMIGYYVLLTTLSYGLLNGWEGIPWALLSILPMILFVMIYVGLYNRQAKAREQAQTLAIELEKANQQLTEYAARVEDLTIVNERQRMARELHDTLSQGLAGLILQLEAADAHLAHNRTDKVQSIIGNAMVQARSTLADARRAIDDLRQSSLDDLESALRLEISRFTNATGIPILFHADLTPPLPGPVKETLIRAVAEALTNIANHAQAQNVAVDVRMKDKSLSVTIQDDGVGFDVSAIPFGHYGLLGIRERVRLANGSFEIRNESGTTLKIEIPMHAEQSASAVASSPKGEAPL